MFHPYIIYSVHYGELSDSSDTNKCTIPYHMFITFSIYYILYIVGPLSHSRYSNALRNGRSGDRIPVEARFSALVHTGPGAHPASEYFLG